MKDKKIVIVAIIIGIILIVAVIIGLQADSNKKVAKKESEQEFKKIATSKEKLVFKDTMFITQINDIYENTDDYLGREVEIEGFPMTQNTFTYVGRYGPGCCTGDAYACLEYEYPEKLDLLDEKDWIKVQGTIEQGVDNGEEYIYIKASSIEKMETRGKDTVAN